MGRKSKSTAVNSSISKSVKNSLSDCDKTLNINRIDLTLILVSTISIVTRFYDIHEPAHVCWDETHFGKMASWYINRTFFFDVHPPLGKMLIAFSGTLTGYNGSFAFDKPGDRYEHWSQYVGMRSFCAALGTLIPILIYLATKAITKSYFSAMIAATLLLFDNGLITLTRYILLDPPLLLFESAAILGFAKFSFEYGSHVNYNKYQFSRPWWFWLTWTGVSIVCASSVKFVGLFIVALIGMRTIYDLWEIIGDIRKDISYTIKHFLARVICLILLPIFLYCSIFWIHLKQLDHTGNGDGFYSSAFQSQLIGNSLHNSSSPEHLAYGAEVTIKSNRIGGAYLHSHWHLYPEGVGARQQQVTTYSHKDSNNKWKIKRAFNLNTSIDDIYVRDGDLIVLEHYLTKRNLHSHFEPAPITKRHYQVTCYGDNGIGDANDIWRIQKEKTNIADRDSDDLIYTVRSRFKLVHYLTACALHSHSRQLPKWAYDQLEVTCNPKIHDRNNLWNIEDNYYPDLPNVSFEAYSPNFLDRFIESHAVMLQGNAGLKPKEGEITSRPWQWPINYEGQFFSASKEQKVYLLGNPFIWWVNLMAIPIGILMMIGLAIYNKIQNLKRVSKIKHKNMIRDNYETSYLDTSTWILFGWALHYIPFYFMGRILYFHHYFPAFIFSCMLTAITFDHILTETLRRFGISSMRMDKVKVCIFIVPASIVIYNFVKYIPTTYGLKSKISEENSTIESWRREQQISSLKWLP